MDYVYLLHFGPASADTKSVARHYLGLTRDQTRRLGEHRAGRGAAFTRAMLAEGRRMDLAKTWTLPTGAGTPYERSLKNRKNASALCPMCNPAVAPSIS